MPLLVYWVDRLMDFLSCENLWGYVGGVGIEDFFDFGKIVDW